MRPDDESSPAEWHMDECEQLALENLARGRFLRFGFYAAQWRWLNRLSGARRDDPFRDLAERAGALNQPR